MENRLSIEEYTTLARGIILRGHYRPGGDSGAGLRRLMMLSAPSLYPHARTPERIDVQALRYVLQRLPDRIWSVGEITVARQISPMLARDFSPVATAARRRLTYRTGPDSLVTAFRGGMSDLLDFVSALTCYQMETDKIRAMAGSRAGKPADNTGTPTVWERLDSRVDGDERNSLIHALSVQFRSGYDELKELDEMLEGRLPEFVLSSARSSGRALKVIFTDRFGLVGSYNQRAKEWASLVAEAVRERSGVHLVSSNRHSLLNLMSPWVSKLREEGKDWNSIRGLLEDPLTAEQRASSDADAGILAVRVPDDMPFCQIAPVTSSESVINMDYAFGEEGFFLLNELCQTFGDRLKSVFIMGKAGTLNGARGDVMLPSYFVKQGTGDVYAIDNCLSGSDFPEDFPFAVHSGGPMLTVDGTFMQNKDVLEYFRNNWSALGVEMEGIPYVKALTQAVLRKRIPPGVPVGVVYYASDAPLRGDTLSTPMGEAGVVPVYAASEAVLNRIRKIAQ